MKLPLYAFVVCDLVSHPACAVGLGKYREFKYNQDMTYALMQSPQNYFLKFLNGRMALVIK